MNITNPTTSEFEARMLAGDLMDIAREASAIIMNVYQRVSFETTMKDDQSPLTIADTQSSDYICRKLSEIDPGIPIICEETKLQSYDVRKHFKKYWLVDPLDGTKEFVKRNGEFTVNIALVERTSTGDYVPTMGVVSVPVKGHMYVAEKGFGAWKYSMIEGTWERLECEPFDADEPVTIVCSRSHLNKETEMFSEQFNVKETIVSGSSIKFMKLCENEAQVYPRLHPCMEWDIAASDAILREAGGQILTPDATLMPYNKPDLLVESFIAYGKGMNK